MDFWYEVSPSRQIKDYDPPKKLKGKKPETHKKFSQIPVEISHAMKSLLEDTYEGAA